MNFAKTIKIVLPCLHSHANNYPQNSERKFSSLWRSIALWFRAEYYSDGKVAQGVMQIFM